VRRKRFRLLFRHGSALKSMAKLGPLAFGPKCPSCGFSQTSGMIPAHRDAIVAVTGRQPEELEYVCHCGDAKAPPADHVYVPLPGENAIAMDRETHRRLHEGRSPHV
jgi:hypothetical protein